MQHLLAIRAPSLTVKNIRHGHVASQCKKKIHFLQIEERTASPLGTDTELNFC